MLCAPANEGEAAFRTGRGEGRGVAFPSLFTWWKKHKPIEALATTVADTPTLNVEKENNRLHWCIDLP